MEKILFIGNSYTYFYDMPEIFRALAEENGAHVQVDAVTKGGRKLYENLIEGDEKKEAINALCRQNKYDILFLQEQSYLAIVDYPLFERGIKGLIQEVKPQKTILYSTWGRKEGCPLLDNLAMSSEEMTDGLSQAYIKAASSSGAEISPVGKCFCQINRLFPEIELYDPDLSHPSYPGSCVAAVCHYRAVFGKMPEKHASLKAEKADIQKIFSVIEKV